MHVFSKMGHFSMRKRSVELAILVSHPIQYFAPLFRELSSLGDIDLVVVYRTQTGLKAYQDPGFGEIVQWDIPLLDGYRHVFLSCKNVLHGIEPNVLKWLFCNRPDVLLVHGYNYLTNILAIIFAKMLGIKVLLRGDTRLTDRHKNENVKWLLKRSFFRLVDGFLTIGSLNRDYYLAHGVEETRLYFSPFSVDNKFFCRSAAERFKARAKVRRELKIPSEACVILFVGKFIQRKRAQDVVLAFQRICAIRSNVFLVMVGSGPMAAQIQEIAVEMCRERIIFAGFKNQSEIPEIFAASDMLIVPSEDEPWGLIVNEAMAAGLPVIASDQVGSAPDLIENKGTGYVYPCGNIEALAQCMVDLIDHSEKRTQMGQVAVQLISLWDTKFCAEMIRNAVHDVISK